MPWFFVSAAAGKVTGRVVLEKLYYMRFDSDTELKTTDNKKTCELPDGIIIPVDAERFHRVDILFQPDFIGKEASGFHDTSFLSNLKK